MVEITILYDNHVHPSNKKLAARHGFAAYIEFEDKKILFDCGWDGNLLLNNAKILGIPLDDLDAVFISHGHWDHCGGIISVLSKNKKFDIYLPSDFSTSQPKEYGNYLTDPFIQKISSFQQLNRINENLASTGCYSRQGTIGEQALLLRYGVNNETILIVGCLHPGLRQFMQSVGNFGKITTLLGGIHGFKDIDYLTSTSIQKMYLGHCTKYFDKIAQLNSIKTTKLNVGFHLSIPNSR